MTAKTTSLRQMKYQKGKRGRGECGFSGCKVLSANYYCPSHALKVQEKHRAWYARRVRPIKSSEPNFGEAK